MTLTGLEREIRGRWLDTRPWQTNLALILVGTGMLLFTRQLLVEGDRYVIGFSGCSTGSLMMYLGALAILLVRPRNTDRFTLPIILFMAMAFRFVGVFHDPFLSSDVYRYAWDGVVQHAHISPFRYVPGDPALSFLRDPNRDLFDNMNRRDYAPTLYPPVAQAVFYLITFLSPTVEFMKMGMVLFECLTVYGLLLMLKQLGMRREWVLLYAWCPLCIWEFGSSGHLDAVVAAFLVFAFLFRYRQQPVLTGLFLGLAVFTKFYPIVLFPALYQRQRNGRLDWKMPATMVGVGVAFYSMYLSAGKLVFGFLGGYVGEEGIATGTRYFPLEWIRTLPGLDGFSNSAFMVACGLVFAALSFWAWRTCCRAESHPASFFKTAMCFGFALMLMFSPHYPWYVAWLIPFFVLCPSITVMTYVLGLFYLCTTALAVGSGPKQFHLNEILYSAVLVAAIIEVALYRIPHTRRWLQETAPFSFSFETLTPTSRTP